MNIFGVIILPTTGLKFLVCRMVIIITTPQAAEKIKDTHTSEESLVSSRPAHVVITALMTWAYLGGQVAKGTHAHDSVIPHYNADTWEIVCVRICIGYGVGTVF